MNNNKNNPCAHCARRYDRGARGFTMVEMVTVIAITGIIAAAVALFLKFPLQAYQDTERRAALGDTADTVFVRMQRDIETALPNSVRVTTAGNVVYLEFLQVRTSGRYRSVVPVPAVATGADTCPDTNSDTFADENVLQFGVADTCFTTLGTVPDLSSIATNSDYVVVYNLGPGFTNADAYASGASSNKSLITAKATGAGGENVITFQSHTFTLESPGRHFQVISGPITYVCDPDGGTISRISGYAIAASQPTPPVGTTAQLAQGITACTVTYDQNVINQRVGVVSMWIKFADPNATIISMFQQVQTSNVP